MGDFTCLPGEREKKCPGGRLPLNAGELEALHICYKTHLVTYCDYQGLLEIDMTISYNMKLLYVYLTDREAVFILQL